MAYKTYVGYDLGDGETITDVVTLEVGKITAKTVFDNMTMPDTVHSGQAMPTIFAFDENGEVIFSQTISADPTAVRSIVVNFKRRPSDMLPVTSAIMNADQIDVLRKSSGWPKASVWPDGNSAEMLNFKNAVIAFTNAVFSDSNYRNRLRSVAQASDEIVFCVGHPTNWSEQDIVIYELILRNTILGCGMYEGKKSSIIMEAESRAAFLYSKDVEAFGRLPRGSSVLLIDIGSSTVDITAMTATSNNHQFNSGSNYLGARSIDFMIRDWYLEKIKQQPLMWSMYQSLVAENPTISNALTLSCRRAKEQLYSSPKRMSVISFGLFPGIRLAEKDLDHLIDGTPVADILKETINLKDQECALMGDKSWKTLFKEFLLEKKEEMSNQGIRAGYIILTGSASKMTFVPNLVLEVFNEVSADSLKYDMDPSRTISKGLALVGPSNEKSKAYQQDIQQLLDEKLEKIIEKNIPALGKEMGNVLSDILKPQMKQRVLEWKNGRIDTLAEMNQKIESDCSEKNLVSLLSDNAQYKKTIESWLKNKVGKDIAIELKEICNRYGVRDIHADDLNIMTMPQITIGELPLDPLEFMDTVGGIIAIIAGVISYTSIATIMAVVVMVISCISESLAFSLFLALVGMGPVGWGILAGVVGVTVTVVLEIGFDNIKESFEKKVMSWNLPAVARMLMTEDKINKSFTEANIPNQIAQSFEKVSLRKDIVDKVSKSLKGQIEKRAEDIKYAIESK